MGFTNRAEFVSGPGSTYAAIRDRLVLSHMGVQKGVFGDTDFLVAPSSAMTLSVAAGDAMIQASHPTLSNRGLYHVNSDASEPITIPTSSPSNPRLDQIVLVVSDPSYDPALITSGPTIQVVQGTATAAPPLNNRTGAAATLPPSSLRLADVLVPAGATTISAAQIRDRRPWARGNFKRVVYNAGEFAVASMTMATIGTFGAGMHLRNEI